MKILITGPSGSGKSAVGNELMSRGFDVIETDKDVHNELSIAYWQNKISRQGVWMPWPPPPGWHTKNDWVWRIDILEERLTSSRSDHVFACGDSRNKQDAFHLFDRLFLLKVDDDTLYQRIQSREDNYFGKAEEEFDWVKEQNKTAASAIESIGGTIIDAGQPLSGVVASILAEIE